MAEGIRINKYLAEHGICSRREADRYLEEGRIRVNGKVPEMGCKVGPDDRIELDGENILKGKADEPVLLAFYKPRGIVCTTGTKDRAVNVVEYIHYKCRIFPIGRLDKDSEGLLLLTNRGELVNAVNRAVNCHEKEYLVKCRDRISENFLKRMANGVEIDIPIPGSDAHGGKKRYTRVKTAKCSIALEDEFTFRIILTQGLNRQIRRMCEALGNKVVDLKRLRIMNIKLDSLKEGKYRIVSGAELECFERLLQGDIRE